MSFRRSSMSKANKLLICASLCSINASLETDLALISDFIVSLNNLALPNGKISSLQASFILAMDKVKSKTFSIICLDWMVAFVK